VTKRAGWDLSEGDEIAPGRIALEKLGGGKRYEVYLAWDEKLFSQVVVKLVRPDQVSDSRAVPDLRREYEALDRLAHPMLVRHFGAVFEGEKPHVVLEHIEGPTLRNLIKSQGALTLEQLAPLAVQVCGVLHYMSTESIVHLDVKPSNVVMAAPPKLIDLSVARTLEGAAMMKKPVGTRKYMSPEQCDPIRLGPISSPADVWGVGATLFEATTGRRAFETPARDKVPADAPVSVRYPQVVSDPPSFPRDTHPQVARVISACLERAPADRPTASEVALSFEPLLDRIPERSRKQKGVSGRL
jgi:serine/threonine protein kinase